MWIFYVINDITNIRYNQHFDGIIMGIDGKYGAFCWFSGQKTAPLRDLPAHEIPLLVMQRESKHHFFPMLFIDLLHG